ncbi:hypothetical protein PQX77_003172 [Marasmius sp. AFHP31]|nr:hypothetical protein PQX77_003172 [Marasmius sp. AFHP31]
MQESVSLDASATSSNSERKLVRFSVPQIDFLDPRKWVGRGSRGSDLASSDRSSSFDSRGSISQAESASADKKGLTGITKASRGYGQIGRGVGASTSLRSAGTPKMRSFSAQGWGQDYEQNPDQPSADMMQRVGSEPHHRKISVRNLA